MIDATDVQSVVVAFNPGATLQPLCSALLAAGCRVLIVDNASESGRDIIAECRALGAEVIRCSENVGVSGALTIGTEHARESQWLLSFDQDSVIDDAFLGTLFATTASRDPGTAMIGPLVVDAASGDLLQGSAGRSAPFDVPLLITSGALCRMTALDEAGGFRRDLFIDHVDHDICLRLRGLGWRIVVEPSAVMRHTIGGMQTHKVAGVGIRNSHHGPDRQYYKYRNFLLLVRSGTVFHDRRFALRTLLALCWGPLKIVVFEDQRASKLRAIGAGVRDGLAGRGGRRRQGG